MKQCIACGMPMKNPEDFAMGDSKKDYAVIVAGQMGQCNPMRKNYFP